MENSRSVPQAINFDEFDAIWDRLAASMHNKEAVGLIDFELFNLTASKLIEALNEGFKAAELEGYELTGVSSNFKTALEKNIRMFSGFKTYEQMKLANSLLLDSDGEIRSFSKFKHDVLKINKEYNKTYLKAEYNTSISGGQAATKWAAITQDADTFPFLKYTTVGDAVVREDHRLLDGIIKPVNDDFWKRYYPPNDWQCRCTVQRLRAAEVSDISKLELPELKSQFNANMGNSETIFDKEHPYFKLAKSEKTKVNKWLKDNE